MSTMALPMSDLSRTLTLNYAIPRNLNSSAKNTSCWKSLAMVNSARNCFGIKSGFEKNEANLLIRAAVDEGGGTSTSPDFGDFEVHEALLDEEFWAAASLRAECDWEDKGLHERHAGNFKWLYAEKEFFALKKRCSLQLGINCKCIIMVKKEEDDDVEGKKEKNSLVDRLAGTLDLHVQYFLPGQTIPVPDDRIVSAKLVPIIDKSASNSYGYILNLCVAKSARRLGLATSMLRYAISAATEQGAKKVFLRVYGDNEAAVGLYEKMGFKLVEGASCASSSDQPLMLMCFEA